MLGLAVSLLGCSAKAPTATSDALAGQLQTALTDALGVPVRVGGASLDLAAGRIAASAIEIDAADGTPMLRARALSLASRLQGVSIDLGEVVLDDAEVTLRIADGAIVGLPARDPDAPPANSPPTEVTLRNSRFTVSLGSWHATLSARAAHFTRTDAGLRFAIAGGDGQVGQGESALRLQALGAQGSAGPDGVRFEALEANGPGTKLTLRHASLAGRKATGSAALTAPLGRVLGALDLHAPAALADAALHLALVGEDGQVDARGTLSPSQGGSIAFDATVALDDVLHTELRATLSQVPSRILATTLAATRATADAPTRATADALPARLDATVTLAGALALAGPRATGTWTSPLPAGTLGDWPLPALRLHGTLGVSAAGVTLGETRVTLADAEARIAGLPLRVLEAGVERGDEGTILLNALEMRGRGLRLHARQLIVRPHTGTNAPPGIEGVVELRHASLARLLALLGIARGDASALQARATGTLRLAPSDAGATTLSLSLRDAYAFGQRFPRGTLEARYVPGASDMKSTSTGTLHIDALSLQESSGRAVMTAEGTLEAGGRRTLSVSLDALPLEVRGGDLSVSVSGHGKLGGDAATPDADFDLQLRQLRAAGLPLGDLRLRAALRDTPLAGCPHGASVLAAVPDGARAWMLCGAGDHGKPTVDIGVATAPGRPVRGELTMRGLSLLDLLPHAFGPDTTAAQADVALSLQQGSLDGTDAPAGTLAIADARLSTAGLTLRATAPVTARVDGGRITLPPIALSGPHGTLSLSGTVDASAGLSLHGDGNLDAGYLATRSRWTSAAYGRVPLSLSVTGPLAAPEAVVTLRPEDVIVVVQPLGIWIQSVYGEARLEGEDLVIEDLHGRFGGGMLTLRGATRRDADRTRTALALQVRDVVVEPDARLRAALDADLDIERTPEAALPTLGGEVRLRALRYARRIGLPEALAALEASNDRGEPGADGGAGQLSSASSAHFALDLHLVQAGPLRLHNNLVDTELRIPRGLRLLGTDARPGLLGEAVLDGGHITFRGDEFQLTRGTLRFEDARSLWPHVDLAGEAPARKREGAHIAFDGRGGRERFALEIRCQPRPGDAAPVPAPFRCDYGRRGLQCGDYRALLTLFLCQPDRARGR